jgi:tetratricopeptide (TPR) repeat protein
MADTAPSKKHFAAGSAALRRREPELARAHFLAAHTLASPLVSGHALRGLAQAALQDGDGDRALELLEAARKAYQLAEELVPLVEGPEATGNLDAREGQATCLVMAVDVHYHAGRFDQARASLDLAYPLYRSLDGRRSQADLWSATARLAQHDSRWAVAGSAWQKVIRIAESHRDTPLQALAWLRLAEVRLRDADLDAAESCVDKADPIARDLEDHALLGRMWSARAAIAYQRSDVEAAWDMGLDAVFHLEKSHDKRQLNLARLRLAQFATKTRPSEAIPTLREVLDAERSDAKSPLLATVAQRAADLALQQQAFGHALLAARAEEGLAPKPQAARQRQIRALLALEEDDAAAWLAAYEARRVGDDFPAAVAMAESLGKRLPSDAETSYETLATEAMPRRDQVVVRIARQRGIPLEHLSTARGIEMVLDTLGRNAGTLAVASPEAQVASTPVLVWEDALGQEQVYELPVGVTTIGRGRSNAIQIAWDSEISRAHASVVRIGHTLRLQDLESEKGTFVGTEQVSHHALAEGDTFQLGSTFFRLEQRKSAVAAVVAKALSGTAAVAIAP